jgi:hypothetical protein
MTNHLLSQDDPELLDVPDLKEEDPEIIDSPDDQSDFESFEREPVEEETFEEEGDDMNKVKLHDLNTLKHLYRFGLIRPARGIYPGAANIG